MEELFRASHRKAHHVLPNTIPRNILKDIKESLLELAKRPSPVPYAVSSSVKDAVSL